MGMINPLGACDNSLPPNCDAPPTLCEQVAAFGAGDDTEVPATADVVYVRDDGTCGKAPLPAVAEYKFLAILNQAAGVEVVPTMDVVVNTLGLAGTWAWTAPSTFTFTFTNMTLPVVGTAARINNNMHDVANATTVYATVLLTGTPRSGLLVTVGAADEDERTLNAVLEVISNSMPTLIVP